MVVIMCCGCSSLNVLSGHVDAIEDGRSARFHTLWYGHVVQEGMRDAKKVAPAGRQNVPACEEHAALVNRMQKATNWLVQRPGLLLW